MTENQKTKLIILPYAGGSGLFFSQWPKILDEHITISPVELPGRGLRYKEPLCDSLDEVIDKIFDYVKGEIEDCNYAFFGYCVGSVMVYELHKRIVENDLKEPSHCFLCAHPAPHIQKKGKRFGEKSNEELIEEWLWRSRIRKEDFESKEYLKGFFHVWKADCAMMDRYRFKQPMQKFNCDLTLISGNQDTIFAPVESMNEWKKFTSGRCREFAVEGSHDFLKTNESAVIDIINEVL